MSGTRWDNNDALQRAILHFEKNAKKKVCFRTDVSLSTDLLLGQFDSPEMVSSIQLDGFKTVPGLGITRGRLRVSGQVHQLGTMQSLTPVCSEEMVSFFAPSLKVIKEGLKIAFENGHKLADV